MWNVIQPLLAIMALAFAQNTAFSIVSRSRNRNSTPYHLVAAVLSNGVWYATYKFLITADMSWSLFVPYTIGTVSGSILGVKISQRIEAFLKLESDSHIKP